MASIGASFAVFLGAIPTGYPFWGKYPPTPQTSSFNIMTDPGRIAEMKLNYETLLDVKKPTTAAFDRVHTEVSLGKAFTKSHLNGIIPQYLQGNGAHRPEKVPPYQAAKVPVAFHWSKAQVGIPTIKLIHGIQSSFFLSTPAT